MGFLSWLFGSKKQQPLQKQKKQQKPKQRKTYGYDERHRDHQRDLENYKSSPLGIKKIKIIVDKQDLDACAAIKRMKKIHNINEVPAIPLDRNKCEHCTCYYEPIAPKDF